ncbi:MAG: hypothetical protein HY855_25055 [Burkholderiales bacterium]|nr:hypothetical protein [Burkholderiales bacterium]
MKRFALILLAAASALQACSGGSPTPAARRDPAKASGPARVDATLQLPQGDGRVHVIAIPSEFGEVTRCLVAVSTAGMVSTSCSPKDIDLAPPAEN